MEIKVVKKILEANERIPGKHINLRFHATLMAGAGDPAIEVMEETAKEKKGGYILVVEGAIPTLKGGTYGTIGERKGKLVTMLERVESLGKDALAVVALGTCAAFGGIPAASPNPTDCKRVTAVLDSKGITTPVVNIPGCPPHPDWFVGTVASILLFGLPKPEDLDDEGRPLAFYGSLIRENCPRRAVNYG